MQNLAEIEPDLEFVIKQLLDVLAILDRMALTIPAIRVCEALEALSPGDPRIAALRHK